MTGIAIREGLRAMRHAIVAEDRARERRQWHDDRDRPRQYYARRRRGGHIADWWPWRPALVPTPRRSRPRSAR
jgi:hypothetical protein